MSSVNSLKDLFLEQIRGLCDAEEQLLSMLPQMAFASNGSDLKQVFTDHLEQTDVHLTRLQRVLELLDASPESKICQAMNGLVFEACVALELPEAVRDAGLIGAAQSIEHHEIAAYCSALSLAEKIGCTEAADLLQDTLDEERAASASLFALVGSVYEPFSAQRERN